MAESTEQTATVEISDIRKMSNEDVDKYYQDMVSGDSELFEGDLTDTDEEKTSPEGDDEEQEVEPQETETDKKDTTKSEEKPVGGETKEEIPETPEILKSQLDAMNQKYKSLQGIIDARGRELEDTRRQLAEYNQFMTLQGQKLYDALEGKAEPSVQSEEYDPYNPQTIDNRVERKVRELMQMQEGARKQLAIRSFTQNWQAKFKADIDKLVAENSVPPDALNETMTRFQKAFTPDGFSAINLADIIFKGTNFDRLLAEKLLEAEKRGATKAAQNITDKMKTNPKRASSVSGKVQFKDDGGQLSDLTDEALYYKIRSTKAGTPEFKKLEKEVDRRLGKE